MVWNLLILLLMYITSFLSIYCSFVLCNKKIASEKSIFYLHAFVTSPDTCDIMAIFYDVPYNVLLASMCSLLNEEPGLMGGWCDLVTVLVTTPGPVLHGVIDVSLSAPRPNSPHNLIMFFTWVVFFTITIPRTGKFSDGGIC